MNLAPVAGLLERRIGLDPAALGPTVLPAAVADRMRALGLADPAAYADRLADGAEFAALVERLVVPETWFFRGGELFPFLARHVAAALPELPGRPFRALCLPCSTGEEPYSLAMTLLDAGISPDRWVIDAVDLSPRLIAAARRGVYREFSFRQTDPELRGRYFRPAADGWELDAGVRGQVRFHVGNLLDPTSLPDEAGGYDLILCRNLLIYLTPTARGAAVASLERLLTPGGLLGVGHAEPQVFAGRPFRRVGAEAHFLFRRELVVPPSPLFRGRGAAGEGVSGTQYSVLSTQFPSPPAPLPQRGEGRPRDAEPPLTLARRLADAGRLDDALAALRQAPPSADAYSLLGVVQQARGDRAAASEAFRKALYLAPDHAEALTHTMLLAAEGGDADRAAALRERLARTGGEP
jgi:chemotaxis protein methyltransferase WspC